MKSFIEFLKEEISLRGNKGVPDNFMSDADKQAQRNLSIRKDDISQMRQYGPRIGQLMDSSRRIMLGNLNDVELEERFVKLEELAKRVILEQYSEILESNEKPIDLIIKLVRPGSSVTSEISEIGDIPAKPESVVLKDKDIKNSVDKKKILNAITQGEAKSTKNIIKFSEIVEPALRDIFGNESDNILNIWLETIEVADKLDWILPIDIKSEMMKDAPLGIAGACQVNWEKDEDSDEDEKNDEKDDAEYNEDEVEEVGDSEDYDRITIKAVGIDFPMLIHESIKGIWHLIKSGAIKDNPEIAGIISRNTSSFEDESEDFRYGVALQGILRDFVNSCKDSNKYSNMNLRIFGLLALDKDRGGKFTDEEFLKLFISMVSSFDLVEKDRKFEFTIIQSKFNSSDAKRQIEELISEIVSDEKEYEKSLSQWEMEERFKDDDTKSSDDDSDDDNFGKFLSDNGLSSSKPKKEEEEEEEDIDDLLDKLSSASTDQERSLIKARLDKLTESLSIDGQRIYSLEIKRINEMHILHKK
jgi:hypothetical protein